MTVLKLVLSLALLAIGSYVSPRLIEVLGYQQTIGGNLPTYVLLIGCAPFALAVLLVASLSRPRKSQKLSHASNSDG